jgi:uncharacterized integral membrane protein
MKFLSRALFLLFILVGVLIAVSNTQTVQLALWPLPHVVVMPVYLLVIALLLLGVLTGLSMGWWAARHHRRRAREAGGEAARLERELGRLRTAEATARPRRSLAPLPRAPHRATRRPSNVRALWSPRSWHRPAPLAVRFREDPVGGRS